MDNTNYVGYLGTITLFPYLFTPLGFLRCNGRILRTSDYPDLAALLKNSYGGDGINTFALPNMLGLEPYPGVNYCICWSGIYPPPPPPPVS